MKEVEKPAGNRGDVAAKICGAREEKLGSFVRGWLARAVIDHAVPPASTPAARPPSQKLISALWPPVLLVLVAGLIWCAAHGKWTAEAWQVPLDFSGDAAETLARIKAAQEGDLVPFSSQKLSRFGAPFGAEWNEYPSSDSFANYALGVLARWTGVGAASNLALLLAHMTAALAFYAVARWLRYRREWGWGGALLFAFAHYYFARGLPHLWLMFTATVPLALMVCWIVGGSRQLVLRRWVWLASLGAAAVLGASNPYNLFLFLQLAGWATLAAIFRGRRGNARLGGMCIVVALVMAALAHLPTWIYHQDEGATPLLVRNYAGTEVYALKPIELFLPPATHRSELVATLGQRYVRWSDWRGETFSPYLGLVGGLGLLGLLGYSVKLLLASPRPRLPASGLQAIWIMLFSAVGGLNALLAFYGGLQVFRATNRFSMFLCAIALLFLVGRASRWTRQWPASARVALMLAIVALGLLDQIPRRASAEQREAVAARYHAIEQFGREIEAGLADGAMVFQLPVLEFPEGRPRYGLDPLDKFHPYLATETLRFSFGSRKNRSRSRWKIEAERLPAPELVARLERAGFSAILIEKTGFEDRADSLLRELAEAGRSERVPESHADYAVIKLQPAREPVPPFANKPTLGRGWYPPIPGSSLHRWAYESAAMAYHNPFEHEVIADVRLVLRSPNARTVEFRHAGEALTTLRLAPDQPGELRAQVRLAPGVNRFELHTDEPAVRRGEQRWGLRAFGLVSWQWRVDPAKVAEEN